MCFEGMVWHSVGWMYLAKNFQLLKKDFRLVELIGWLGKSWESEFECGSSKQFAVNGDNFSGSCVVRICSIRR